MLLRVAAVLTSVWLVSSVAQAEPIDQVETSREDTHADGLAAVLVGGTQASGRAAVAAATTLAEHRLELDGGLATTAQTGQDARTLAVRGRWAYATETWFVDMRAGMERREQVTDDTTLQTREFQLALRAGRRLRLGELEHRLGAGLGLVQASAEGELGRETMLTHPPTIARTLRGEHRFLTAYIDDTVRFIRGLDVTTGLVIEQWRALGGDSSITYGSGPPMDVDTPDVASLLVSPSISMVGHITEDIALVARTDRGLAAPDPYVRPERVWTTEAGVQIARGALEARATSVVSTIDDATGMERTSIGDAWLVGGRASASWRPTSAWLGTASYAFTRSQTEGGHALALVPAHTGAATLSYLDGRVLELSAGVRWRGASYRDDANTQHEPASAVIDALCARSLSRSLRGYVAVDNALDRRYLGGRGALDARGGARTIYLGLTIGVP